MSFFPRAFYEGDSLSSFTPLFRLLDDFDTYARQSGSNQHGRLSAIATWQPKFDIRETSDAYELHGELPGLNKDAVHIEFTDPQTMTVRGKAERTYSSGTPSAGRIEDVSEKPAITEGETSPSAHKATVEDDNAAATETAVGKAQRQPEQPKYKYWLTERSVGEFSRSFNFPTPVDHESVSASFRDGILAVSVPKAKKPEPRRIAIN
ncbi:heat shock protein 30 [Pochonia chlamydosporia 170]|uniref:Heat shock protein 30 n=1 Tax=Pochonia chlamydosporia 170 TaxID=1380566 RepID=A0A179EXT4_METCM|nr:heat shock protein 30 [Pochonia chlamydosporia 170]OAQ57994.1 heat shock protein 30 [Pochonia chlamydosporia 170]